MKKQSIKDLYLAFSLKNHAAGSHASGSYVTAMDIIDIACHQNNFFLEANESVWDICDANRLTKLYEIIKKEIKKDNGGIFRDIKPKSYWQNNYCSAAVGEFTKFLILIERESIMLQKFETINDAQKLTQELDKIGIVRNTLLISDNRNTIDVNSREGKEKLAEVMVRQNQNVFRKMILSIYEEKCCLTGLPMEEVLRASHISAWADDDKNRMNPENGLCLSATYDAAFDRHLISFDEDYRLIFASSLKDYYTNEAFKEQFQRLHGKKISMPIKFLPSQDLLAKHREHLVG